MHEIYWHPKTCSKSHPPKKTSHFWGVKTQKCRYNQGFWLTRPSMVVPLASVKQRCGALMRLTCFSDQHSPTVSGIFLGSNFLLLRETDLKKHSWNFVSSWRFPQVYFDECRTNSPSIKNCHRKNRQPITSKYQVRSHGWPRLHAAGGGPPKKGLKFLRLLKQNNQCVQFFCCAWRKKKNANSFITLFNAHSVKLPHQPTNLTNSNSPSGKSVNIHGVA